MWLLFLLMFQGGDKYVAEKYEPDQINAQAFVDGKRLEMTDIRIKGVQPYTFEFHLEDGSTLVSIFSVSRIEQLEDQRLFKVLFINGEEKTGRIKSLSFTANPDPKTGKRQVYLLYHLERVHFIQGEQLRSCAQGHYEQMTPYPFCPVCGNPLQLGPYEEVWTDTPVLPTHTLRQDGRDPSSSALRNY